MTDPNPFREGEEAPPRGVRVMAWVRWVLLLLVAIVALAAVRSAAAPASKDLAELGHGRRYHCPMHPEITADGPGECPICQMALVPMPPPLAAPRDTPRSTSGPKQAQAPALASATGAAAAPPPPGVVPVNLSFDRVQAAGVRTEPVTFSTSAEPLRVAAAVEAPERSAAEVHVRTPGFIETIAVREVGSRVRAGQPLATIYSPDVYRAEQELLSVLDWKQTSNGAPPPVGDARRRLELLGMPQRTIDAIVEKREPIRAFAVAAPIDGYVVRRTAVLGAYVTPETTLFEIVGLDRVYVVASLAPSLLSRLKVGDVARFTSPSLPDRVFEAKIDLVYPVVDAVLGQARVRFSLKNPDQALRPGLAGIAEFAGTPGTLLPEEILVPLDAVVQTGRSAYVFVAEGDGRFSPRAVEVGAERGDQVVVRGNLARGDRVVSRATFLVDSESRLRASFVRSAGTSDAPSPPGSGAP